MDSTLAIVALGGLAGRVDQSFSLINQLYKSLPRELYLVSPQNISFLLLPGRNRIYASKEAFGPCCGIIPITGPTTITLEGFRWNLGAYLPYSVNEDNFITEFGGMVSTSNEILGETATVTTDKHILWTIEFRRLNIRSIKRNEQEWDTGDPKNFEQFWMYHLKVVSHLYA
jgi:thiamine pyrophosphokinase